MNSTPANHDPHYAGGDIEAAITAALAARGDAALRVEDLAGLDQFHTGGLQATRALAQLAGITAADRVLDVGGGLGGPARLLAEQVGCHVTVVDLTAAYCRVGALLTARVGLSDRVRFQHGDALDLLFEDGDFDVVWTQHSSMNIADKARLYGQIGRVLRPGGRLALFEVAAGSGEAPHFPALWARSAATSFLIPPEALRATLAEAGLRELAWQDRSDWALAWMRARQAAQPQAGAAPGALGLHLLLGADVGAMLGNHVRNLAEGRIRIVEGVFERP